jgi:predicted nucleic acid-binding Zn ribbon protein
LAPNPPPQPTGERIGSTENDIGMNRALSSERTKEISMFLALFVIFLVFWLLGFLAFHVAGGFIHLLLIVAVIFLVVHFFRRA